MPWSSRLLSLFLARHLGLKAKSGDARQQLRKLGQGHPARSSLSPRGFGRNGRYQRRLAK